MFVEVIVWRPTDFDRDAAERKILEADREPAVERKEVVS
jgi:hypothetical protein